MKSKIIPAPTLKPIPPTHTLVPIQPERTHEPTHHDEIVMQESKNPAAHSLVPQALAAPDQRIQVVSARELRQPEQLTEEAK